MMQQIIVKSNSIFDELQDWEMVLGGKVFQLLKVI